MVAEDQRASRKDAERAQLSEIEACPACGEGLLYEDGNFRITVLALFSITNENKSLAWTIRVC